MGKEIGKRMKVWVLVRRYEWEDLAQQTEYCDTFVFAERKDALAKARRLLHSDMRKYSDLGSRDYTHEAYYLGLNLTRKDDPWYCVKLTDGDNVVYELYRRTIG